MVFQFNFTVIILSSFWSAGKNLNSLGKEIMRTVVI